MLLMRKLRDTHSPAQGHTAVGVGMKGKPSSASQSSATLHWLAGAHHKGRCVAGAAGRGRGYEQEHWVSRSGVRSRARPRRGEVGAELTDQDGRGIPKGRGSGSSGTSVGTARAVGREGPALERSSVHILGDRSLQIWVVSPGSLSKVSATTHRPAWRWDPRAVGRAREEQSRAPRGDSCAQPGTTHPRRSANQFQTCPHLLLFSPTLWVFKPHPSFIPTGDRILRFIHSLSISRAPTSGQHGAGAQQWPRSCPRPHRAVFPVGMAISQRTVRGD